MAASKSMVGETKTEDNVDQRDIGECPVCSETRENTRYYSCLKGHPICVLCKAEISKCGICKGGFSDPPARNIAVEEYIKANQGSSTLNCKFKSHGCPFSGTAPQLLCHERSESCLFIPAPCPAPNCSQMVAESKMNEHIYKEHRANLIFLDIKTKKIPVLTRRCKPTGTYTEETLLNQATSINADDWYYDNYFNHTYSGNIELLQQDSNDFKLIHFYNNESCTPSCYRAPFKPEDIYLVAEHDSAKGQVNIWICIRGSEKLAQKFGGYIKVNEMRDIDVKGKSITFPCNLFNLWTDRNDVLKSTECLELNAKQLLQYATVSNEDKKITIRVTLSVS